ncbi:hypothetical protein EPR50_G00103790 [Perca flavescens]|uniref:NTR domain-containing protein n=1 Tax=Perca flavescens TaxID=8167 RepID=A0A484D2U5_PERFV|nr:hypothetical protein EPR50_G00103790 [Perca flavescens]
MGTLIVQPSGSGESNMAGMTLPVIAATYLDKTNQWETVGLQKRNEALQHIKTGYQNELVFRKSDGSFAVFQQKESSTWLTAYVAKVFAMANNLVEMQSQHICEAIRFLILNAQQTDGEFREIGFMYSNTIRSGVVERESDASMTAFCLIAMQESRPLCAASVNMLQTSIDKAVAYLERRLPHLTYSYAVAMTSYALANENKLNKEILYKFASPELSHWPVSTGHVYTLEATAYALLALVKAEATIMVYQALAEYWASAKEPDYDLNVDILLPGRSKPNRYYFNRDNYYTTRTSKLSKGRASIIAKYEMNTVLSERGSLIIYLDKVSHTRPEEITFRIHQELKVGVLQPAAVSVYEYYDQTHCVKFYHPERKADKLLLLCANDECTCAEENCSKQKKDKIPNEQRTAKVCENTQTSIIDFVYKVRLVNFTKDLSTDIFTVKVLEVIKEGSLDESPQNKQRTFLSHSYCRKSLGLRMGKTYLIMGTSNDIHIVDRPELYQYVFGESTWIEYWPTAAECQTEEHRITCLGMEEMVNQYQVYGCQQ